MFMKKSDLFSKRAIIILILVLVIVVSVFHITVRLSKVENYSHTIASLDEKITTVMELTAAFGFLIPFACIFWIISLFHNPRLWNRLAVNLCLVGLCIGTMIPLSVTISDRIYAVYEESIDLTIDNARNSTDALDGAESDNLVDAIVSKVSAVAGTLLDYASNILKNFIEALAVMIVTTCLIPLLVLAVFLWLMKIILMPFRDSAPMLPLR